jgi:hypothetical protein
MIPRTEEEWYVVALMVFSAAILLYLFRLIRKLRRNTCSEKVHEWSKAFEFKREPYIDIKGQIRYRDSEDNAPMEDDEDEEPEPDYPAMGLTGFWQPEGARLGDEAVEPIAGTLKTWPDYFQLQWDNEKPFEIRRNDRDFKEGQLYYLAEYRPDWTNPCPNEGQPFCSDSGQFTGRKLLIRVKYVMHGPCFGLGRGWVAFGYSIVTRIANGHDADKEV